MPPRVYKAMLAGITAVMLTAVSFVQRALVNDRDTLGLTRYTELKGAPPVLALTTVALGGFRGLISNILWIRASDLQDNEKYFEMVQLADWITKLEPHFTQVWLVQSWNMAYNISVKFKDATDRWRWVKSGIELLRDQGLYYNPHDVLIHRELAWFFQHKMGQNLDDAHMYYKRMWRKEMESAFGGPKPVWDELINPKTPEQKERAKVLREKYKMDPVFMKEVDDRYGPMEWRLPEASAIYWAAQGLEDAKYNERQIDPKDLITLRRVIYQSMQMSCDRGRLIEDVADNKFEFGPNLDIIPKTSAAYEQAMEEDVTNRDHIETAHRNFLRNAVFDLYTYNRESDALNWFKYLVKKYPDKPLLLNNANSLPGTMSLDEYAIAYIQDEVNDIGHDKAEIVIEGMEARAFLSLALGEDEHFVGLDHLAQKIWVQYQSKMAGTPETAGRVGLRPMADIRTVVLRRMLYDNLSPALAAQLRTRVEGLGMTVPQPIPVPASPENGAPSGTNAPPTVTTNAPSAAPETTVK